jgi:hypothetical protein
MHFAKNRDSGKKIMPRFEKDESEKHLKKKR